MTGFYVVMIEHGGEPVMVRTQPTEKVSDGRPVMQAACWRCGGDSGDGELGHEPGASVFGWVMVCSGCVTAGDVEARCRGAA